MVAPSLVPVNRDIRCQTRTPPAPGTPRSPLPQPSFLQAATPAAADGGVVTVRVPGACASLLEVLTDSGFRVGELAMFIASRPFGRLELYLPSGPILC